MPTQIHTTHIYQEMYILCIRADKFLFNPKPDKNHLKVKNYVSKLLMSGFVPESYCVLCSVPGDPNLFGGWVDKRWIWGKGELVGTQEGIEEEKTVVRTLCKREK